jgi:hypothetical protein
MPGVEPPAVLRSPHPAQQGHGRGHSSRVPARRPYSAVTTEPSLNVPSAVISPRTPPRLRVIRSAYGLRSLRSPGIGHNGGSRTSKTAYRSYPHRLLQALHVQGRSDAGGAGNAELPCPGHHAARTGPLRRRGARGGEPKMVSPVIGQRVGLGSLGPRRAIIVLAGAVCKAALRSIPCAVCSTPRRRATCATPESK